LTSTAVNLQAKYYHWIPKTQLLITMPHN